MRHNIIRIQAIRVQRLLVALVVTAGSAIALCSPAAAAGEWDPALPQVLSPGAPGDPVAIANASLGATAQATQTTMDLGRQFLGGLGINVGNSDVNVSPGQRVHGRQASEYVIRRAGSQLGVPYSWGGGSLTGPSKGIDRGANTVGFDCSGLMRYAFAGVGVLIPRYSGDQYNAGRHIPRNQARRGDLLFWGPGGGQHVAMYLGKGKMLEAGGTADKVVISNVRKDGMTPFLTRIIEY